MKPGTVCHLPHRLVNIESIYFNRNLGLQYRFRLRTPDDTIVGGIYMGEAARLHDYICVFDAHPDWPASVDYFTLQKKVFKPNREFPHLILSCYPHTFRRGRNFSSALDYCIRWYILSPFDQDAVRLLKRGLEKRENVLEELKRDVMRSRQMEKCIHYILKHRFQHCSRQGKTEAIIREEYEAFMEDFYKLLYKHHNMVREQFRLL